MTTIKPLLYTLRSINGNLISLSLCKLFEQQTNGMFNKILMAPISNISSYSPEESEIKK